MDITKKTAAGRPPKYLASKQEERLGIQKTASKPEYIFELTHNNTDIFKSMFEAGKQIHKTANLLISPQGLKMVFNAQTGGCLAIIEIFGHRVVSYFADKNYSYQCSVDQILKILKAKKKNHEKISFIIDKNEIYKLKIKMSMGTKITENWNVPLDTIENFDLTEYDNLYKNISEYPLKFKLQWSYFKEVINSWKTFTSGDIYFTKDKGPLKLSFKDAQNESEIIVEDNEFIDLVYSTDEFLAISIPIINLMNCSPNDALANDIYFNIAEKKKMLLFAKLDECYKEKKKPIPDTESANIKFFLTIS